MDKDALVEIVLRECKKIFAKLKCQAESYTKDFGQFPLTALVYHYDGMFQSLSDHFDVKKRLKAWLLHGDVCANARPGSRMADRAKIGYVFLSG